MNGDHGAEEMNRYELESVQLTKEHTNWKRVRFGLTIESISPNTLQIPKSPSRIVALFVVITLDTI